MVHQFISSVIVFREPSTAPPCTTAAAIQMIKVCVKKEAISVLRRSPPSQRVVREKKKHPTQKQIMEQKDLAQP